MMQERIRTASLWMYGGELERSSPTDRGEMVECLIVRLLLRRDGLDSQRDRKPTLDYGPPEAPRVPLYRRVLSGTLILAGIVVAVVPLFESNVSARVNIWTAAAALIVWGVVIRFQHVGL